ncbi:MAG: TatD family hydrolase [Desulfurococcaceae archaeon]
MSTEVDNACFHGRRSRKMIVDAHIHCTELENIDKYANNTEFILVCVADDPNSSREVIEFSKKYSNIIPCIGIHPWNIHEYSLAQIESSLKHLVNNHDVNCLGEIGLDRRFRPHTFDKQLEAFSLFMNYAKEFNLVLNLHAADAWREVFELIYRSNINRAYFHWYTGPLDLLRQIEEIGFYVGFNPAWQIQQKHREILVHANLEYLITESDAPYNYRGLIMTPDLIKKSIEYIATVKKTSVDYVEKVIYSNLKRLFKM